MFFSYQVCKMFKGYAYPVHPLEKPLYNIYVCKVFCPKAGPSLQGSTYLSLLDKKKEWGSISNPFLTEPVRRTTFYKLHRRKTYFHSFEIDAIQITAVCWLHCTVMCDHNSDCCTQPAGNLSSNRYSVLNLTWFYLVCTGLPRLLKIFLGKFLDIFFSSISLLSDIIFFSLRGSGQC